MGLHNSLTYDTMDADLRMRQRLRQKQGSPVVTGVQQVPLNSAGWPCTRSAGAPAPAGGQKSASVLTLLEVLTIPARNRLRSMNLALFYQ